MPETAVSSMPKAIARHSYLYDESTWLVSGHYVNEKSVSIDVEGASVITHGDQYWFNEVTMELKTKNSGEYRNLEYKTVYEYTPIDSGIDSSIWHGSNALMGRLHGVLVFVDDTILSSYQTTSGNIHGMEAFLRVSATVYQCRGALFEAGNKSSSWVLRYEKG